MKRDNLFFILSVLIFGLSVFFLVYNIGPLVSDKATGNSVSFVNLTIEKVSLVNFTIDNVDWGDGFVYSNASYATLNTLGEVVDGSWDNVGSGFVIENIGSTNLSLDFFAMKNATNFIGGANPAYEYMVSNIDDGACISPESFSKDSFHEFPSSGSTTLICDKFLPGKRIKFDLFLRIPYNSKVGNLTDIISVSIEEAD